MVENKNTSDGYDPGQKNSEDQKFLDFEKPIENISEKTLSPDFKRNKKIHNSWLITHG